MGKIREIMGDLFSSPDKLIVHGCNDQRVMGAGIAVPIKNRYPKAVAPYFDANTKLVMGEVVYGFDRNTWIANAITQTLGAKTEDNLPISYKAIETCFKSIHNFCLENSIDAISLPQIGAGLGGGDWDVIRSSLDSVFLDSGINTTVYVYND